jgi:hypothetical protein
MKRKGLIVILVLIVAIVIFSRGCGKKADPEKFGDLQWPTSEIASLLPIPESTVGKVSWERSDGFAIYVGETPREQYDGYVKACSEKGFTVDYSKSDAHYYANNAEGYRLSLQWYGEASSYQPENTMYVSISAPKEEAPDSPSDGSASGDPIDSSTPPDAPAEAAGPAESTAPAAPVAPADPTPPAATGTTSYLEFLQEYEAWVDEYVAFMQKYKANPSDVTLLMDYSRLLGEMTEWSNKSTNLSAGLTGAELKEYLAANTRILAKLASVY